jgi:hypothetical protein
MARFNLDLLGAYLAEGKIEEVKKENLGSRVHFRVH